MVIKTQVEDFMIHADRYLEGTGDKPTVLYAYIERTNVPSMQMSEKMGYTTVGQMDNTFFSRFVPRPHPAVSRVLEEEKETVLRKIRAFYRDYVLFSTDAVFYREGYFVYRDHGKVVAGVQANRVNWEIRGMPGVTGWFFLNIVPALPLLRRFYDGKIFHFASFEAVFFEPEYKHMLIPLFETALNALNVSLGIIWHDIKSKLRDDIRSLPHQGIFQKFISPRQGDIRMRFLNLNSEEISHFYNSPAYISAFDIT